MFCTLCNCASHNVRYIDQKHKKDNKFCHEHASDPSGLCTTIPYIVTMNHYLQEVQELCQLSYTNVEDLDSQFKIICHVSQLKAKYY
jgi:hypothetical protein